jgi:leader peptidase (prepilin peptidase)/N-methyltransferase
MIAIAHHDARRFIIPNALAAAAFALALVNAAVSEPHFMAQAIGTVLTRGLIASAAFLALQWGYRWQRGREGIGTGDIKLAGIAAVWLDWIPLAVAIELAVVAAIATYIVRQRYRMRPLRASSAVPFGLYLAPAIWVGWLLQATVLGL